MTLRDYVPVFFFLILHSRTIFFFFFFNDTATTEIYTLSLHDALPISENASRTRPKGIDHEVAVIGIQQHHTGNFQIRGAQLMQNLETSESTVFQLSTDHSDMRSKILQLEKYVGRPPCNCADIEVLTKALQRSRNQ